MVSWAVELSEYEISFSPRTSIKSQSLADFMVELTSLPGEAPTQKWILSVDGSSNLKGSGAGVVLEGPRGMVLEYSLRFGFSTSNNQAEYEALLAGLRLALEVGVTHLLVRTDSQLVAGQVDRSFQTKDPTLAKYVQQPVSLSRRFEVFEICHIAREENTRADLLSRLASSKDSGINKSVIREVLPVPSVEKEESLAVHDEEDGWMSPIIHYLQQDTLPADSEKAKRLKKISSRFVVESGKLYRLGRATPMLRCVGEKDMSVVMKEVHEGVCGNHGGGRALASRILRVGYYWPTLTRDCLEYVAQCSKCQTFVPAIHTPSEFLHAVLAPWPFYQWGADILGPFPVAPGQLKFLIVAVDYFTKWVEAEAVSRISADRVRRFYWRCIICRFGLPRVIVADNGPHLASTSVVEFCKDLGIQNRFISIEHPQANGQAESANKVILNAIKKKLDSAKGLWAKCLHEVLWAYHTTINSTTQETPFRMVFGADAMIPVEVVLPSWRRENFEEEANNQALNEEADLLDEMRDAAHVRETTAKQRMTRRFNLRVKQRGFKVGDLVLKKVTDPTKKGKLDPNWEGPFRVSEELQNGAYKLETLDGSELPRTWNVASLKFYFS